MIFFRKKEQETCFITIAWLSHVIYVMVYFLIQFWLNVENDFIGTIRIKRKPYVPWRLPWLFRSSCIYYIFYNHRLQILWKYRRFFWHVLFTWGVISKFATSIISRSINVLYIVYVLHDVQLNITYKIYNTESLICVLDHPINLKDTSVILGFWRKINNFLINLKVILNLFYFNINKYLLYFKFKLCHEYYKI